MSNIGTVFIDSLALSCESAIRLMIITTSGVYTKTGCSLFYWSFCNKKVNNMRFSFSLHLKTQEISPQYIFFSLTE